MLPRKGGREWDTGFKGARWKGERPLAPLRPLPGFFGRTGAAGAAQGKVCPTRASRLAAEEEAREGPEAAGITEPAPRLPRSPRT